MKLVYDVSSVPVGGDLKSVIDVVNKSGWLIYDSSRGNKPVLVEEDTKLRLIDWDTCTTEERQKILKFADDNRERS